MTQQQKRAKLRRKADKLIQELGRKTYKKCLVCNKPMNVLHHYYSKSTCSALRYDWDNLIPLCNGCHFSLHNSNPEIQNKINEVKGKQWLEDLQIKKRNLFIKESLGYYQNIIDKLKI